LILTVAVDFGAEYGRNASEIGDGSLNIVSFQAIAEDVEGDAQGYRTRFESGTVDDIDDASGDIFNRNGHDKHNNEPHSLYYHKSW